MFILPGDCCAYFSFRTKTGMETALVGRYTDFIGIARPLVMNPNFPREIIGGERESAEEYTLVKS